MRGRANVLLIGILVLVFGAAGYFVSDWYFGRVNSVDTAQSEATPDVAAPSSARPSISTNLIGSKAPDFSLPDLESELQSSAQWKGEVLLLNFWATWCPPCRKEMPGFIRLQEKYRAQGFRVVGIAIDDVEAVTDFSNTLGVNYKVLIGETNAIALSSRLGNHFGALPYSVLIDREGIIRLLRPGELSEEMLETELTKLL